MLGSRGRANEVGVMPATHNTGELRLHGGMLNRMSITMVLRHSILEVDTSHLHGRLFECAERVRHNLNGKYVVRNAGMWSVSPVA